LTNKGQAAVPASVRRKLNLKLGDIVVFEEAELDMIRLRKAEPLDIEYFSALESTLSEWHSENDEWVYRGL
jgi:antitoxin PrlF